MMIELSSCNQISNRYEVGRLGKLPVRSHHTYTDEGSMVILETNHSQEGGKIGPKKFLGTAVMAPAAQIPLPPANEKVASGTGEVSYTVKTINRAPTTRQAAQGEKCRRDSAALR